jgi:hypothetical protein
LRELHYYIHIIKEQPDKAGESIIQKVMRHALSSKFVMIEGIYCCFDGLHELGQYSGIVTEMLDMDIPYVRMTHIVAVKNSAWSIPQILRDLTLLDNGA